MVGIYFCPESPRWLMKHGKIAQGFKSMSRLRAHPIIGARDYYYSYVIYQEEMKVASGSTYFTRLRDCFTVPRIRRANYGASTVMLAQQMCGINSKSKFFSRPSRVNLTVFSHLFLQCLDLHQCRLQLRPGPIRISRLWRCSGRFHNSHIVLD